MLNSPLIIGCDLREVDDETLAILSNKDIIAINQDIDGRQPFTFPTWHDGYLPDRDGYVKPLSNGDFAIAMFNLTDLKQFFRGNFEEMGLAPTSGRTLKLKNLWTGEEFTSPNKVLSLDIEAHDCLMLRASVVKE
jgi:alpha-galactosidase